MIFMKLHLFELMLNESSASQAATYLNDVLATKLNQIVIIKNKH
jgi:hypothetical protein